MNIFLWVKMVDSQLYQGRFYQRVFKIEMSNKIGIVASKRMVPMSKYISL